MVPGWSGGLDQVHGLDLACGTAPTSSDPTMQEWPSINWHCSLSTKFLGPWGLHELDDMALRDGSGPWARG